MSYPINYPTPQGANVQMFRRGSTQFDWVKPQGASFVWFTLIGAGGGGGGGAFNSVDNDFWYGGGGASGNVTNFMCPAFFLPDQLRVTVGGGGAGGARALNTTAGTGSAGVLTSIVYQQKNTTGFVLVQASGGGGGSGGNSVGLNGAGGTASAADTGGPMTAAGFYQSVGGQNGAEAVVITTGNSTFLMGGSVGRFPTSTITGYYGYTAQGYSGYSQLSPIPLSIPASYSDDGNTVVKQTINSFGCGGNGGTDSNGPGPYTNGGRGGDGLAIIVTW